MSYKDSWIRERSSETYSGTSKSSAYSKKALIVESQSKSGLTAMISRISCRSLGRQAIAFKITSASDVAIDAAQRQVRHAGLGRQFEGVARCRLRSNLVALVAEIRERQPVSRLTSGMQNEYPSTKKSTPSRYVRRVWKFANLVVRTGRFTKSGPNVVLSFATCDHLESGLLG